MVQYGITKWRSELMPQAVISLATMATTGFAFYFLWDNVAVNFAQYRVWVEAGST